MQSYLLQIIQHQDLPDQTAQTSLNKM